MTSVCRILRMSDRMQQLSIMKKKLFVSVLYGVIAALWFINWWKDVAGEPLYVSGCRLNFEAEFNSSCNESYGLMDIQLSVGFKEGYFICTRTQKPSLLDWIMERHPFLLLHTIRYMGPTKSGEGTIRNISNTMIMTLNLLSKNDTSVHQLIYQCDEESTQVHINLKESVAGVVASPSLLLIMVSEGQFSEGEGAVCNDSCLDRSIYDNVIAFLVRRNETGRYSIMYSGGLEYVLPMCIRNEGLPTATTSWAVIPQNTSCLQEEAGFIPFLPKKIYLVSESELYVTGNTLLYSPNWDGVFYQLLLPKRIRSVGKFVTPSIRIFVTIVTYIDFSAELWLGRFGSLEVIRLLNFRSILSQFLNVFDIVLSDTSLMSTSISFTDSDQLIMSTYRLAPLFTGISPDLLFELPLPILILHHLQSVEESDNCKNITLIRHYHTPLLSSTDPQNLTMCQSHACPFTKVLLEAPVCSAITRSMLQVLDSGQARMLSSLPENNCQVGAGRLPCDLFLEKFSQYRFTVTFILQKSTIVPFLVWTSNPDNLNVTVTKVNVSSSLMNRFTSLDQTLSNLFYDVYEIILSEQGKFTGQYMSGYSLASADVDFRVLGGTLQCIDPLSSLSEIPGDYHTRVHIGCPPGLSLVFDTQATMARYVQHCSPGDTNISCYYYGNKFHPVFQISDVVTGKRSLYTGMFSLHVIAGGRQEDSISMFNTIDPIKSGIWFPLNESIDINDPIYPNGSAIKWLCGSRSVCGESFPPPEYYFLLEARGVNTGYCKFSVQFTIQVHGLPVGAVSRAVVLIVSMVVVQVVMLWIFAVWHYREKMGEFWINIVLKGVEKKLESLMTKERLKKEVMKNRAIEFVYSDMATSSSSSSPTDSYSS